MTDLVPTFTITAEENYDAAHIEYIDGITTYVGTSINACQNYQGMQWDPVHRNLMYMVTEYNPATPITNTTGHNLWDGAFLNVIGSAMDPGGQFNSSVGVKNIDTGDVTFYSNYNVANTVPAGIGGGGSDGTYRRNTRDFQAGGAGHSDANGPGMTDPYTGNFWVNSESCQLYCFRLSDNYSQVISPLYPKQHSLNNVTPVGFTDTGATNPWTFAKEIDYDGVTGNVYLYLLPRLLTAAEITADYLLEYATYIYPVPIADVPMAEYYQAYNREVFDHAGNMYVFTCAPVGGKNFALYKFHPPSAAAYPLAAVGGGFTDVTPWGPATGPNADGAAYTLLRNTDTENVESYAVVPLYLPVTDDLVLIEKFFPSEKTALSFDPADMFWSATYVHAPGGSPTFDHHSAFVTGYMTADWTPTDISGAAYAVVDAFEVNTYLGQSDYAYDIDYTTRWFFFLCTKMAAGVSDEKPRIVLVEYSFAYGSAPSVVQVIDEQQSDYKYWEYAPRDNNAYAPFDTVSTNVIAVSMQTAYNRSFGYPMWDIGIHDPLTDTFWWSGGSSDLDALTAIFCQFDSVFSKRMQDFSHVPGAGTDLAATPPFMKLALGPPGPPGPPVAGELTLRTWTATLAGHDFYFLRLGPDATLVYDDYSEEWVEWSDADLDTWRAQCGINWVGGEALATIYSSNIIAGDDTLGLLWFLDPNQPFDDSPDPDAEIQQIYFPRIIQGQVIKTGREVEPCYAVWLTTDMGAPAYGGAGVNLEISDDAGATYNDMSTITATTGKMSPEFAWYSLGQIGAPGRLFKITDDGAIARIDSFEMNDPADK